MKREPRSPYARYNKRPFKYSEAYEHWHDAVLDPSSDDEERTRLSDRHNRIFLGFIPREFKNGRGYPTDR